MALDIDTLKLKHSTNISSFDNSTTQKNRVVRLSTDGLLSTDDSEVPPRIL